MAERRMFAKTIIDSDAFLDMPLSTQSLYFHLSMRADDDGFINNPKKIQRMIGASDDDLKLLIVKNFIIPFESGIVVIKHWKIHNYIRNDRYKETVYKEEMAMLAEKDNKAYTIDTSGIPSGIPSGNQTVYQTETQYRLGKDRLGKGSIESTAAPSVQPTPAEKPKRSRFTPPTLAEVQSYVAERHSPVDPQGFIDFYAAKGWMVGRAPMKDWKAACRNAESWERWQKKPAKTDKPFVYDPGDTTGSL